MGTAVMERTCNGPGVRRPRLCHLQGKYLIHSDAFDFGAPVCPIAMGTMAVLPGATGRHKGSHSREEALQAGQEP
jgi:hypothetical protein